MDLTTSLIPVVAAWNATVNVIVQKKVSLRFKKVLPNHVLYNNLINTFFLDVTMVYYGICASKADKQNF